MKKASDLRKDDVVVDVDTIGSLVLEYRELNAAANRAARAADVAKETLRRMFIASGATVGRISGRPVMYYRAVAGYVEKAFREDRPDLLPHYTVTETVTVERIDWDRLFQDHPEVATKYRKRSLTMDHGNLDVVSSGAVGGTS